MKRSKFTDEQIRAIVKAGEWKAKYVGMDWWSMLARNRGVNARPVTRSDQKRESRLL